MHKVAVFLSYNLEIVKLDLCYNNIGDKGVEILVEKYFSRIDNTLEHLNLVGCNIEGKGIESLASTAETLRLETLRINGNKLGFEVN